MKQLNLGSTNGVPSDPNKTVVHCSTQELAQKVLRIADRLSLMDYWYDKESEACFDLVNDDYGTVEGYKEAGYTILPAEEFIRLNTVEQPGAVIGNPFIPFIKDDKVFNYHKGWGTIMDVSEPPKLLCQVYFDSGECRWMDVAELSFTEYTLQGFSQERPKPEIKEGQLIYVRFKGQEEWKMRYFAKWEGSDVYVHRNQLKKGQEVKCEEYSLTNPLEDK